MQLRRLCRQPPDRERCRQDADSAFHDGSGETLVQLTVGEAHVGVYGAAFLNSDNRRLDKKGPVKPVVSLMVVKHQLSGLLQSLRINGAVNSNPEIAEIVIGHWEVTPKIVGGSLQFRLGVEHRIPVLRANDGHLVRSLS